MSRLGAAPFTPILRPRLRSGPRRLPLMLACLAAFSGGASGCKLTTDDVTIDNIYGPAGRQAVNLVQQARREQKGDEYAGGDELQAAMKLYEELKYAEARKAFKDMVKKYGKKKEPVEEDAMFYLAECDFQLGRLPKADDEYQELLKKYPQTRFLEKSVKRIYAIACYWLGKPKPAEEIELASFTDEDGEERLKDLPGATIQYQFPLKPNFFDKTRPLFDTHGRAVASLKQVWMNDPNAPLAADALMTDALYHFRRGDYQEAETSFKQLREQHFGKNKYFQAAHILGAHASMKCYQGPLYDEKQLINAKSLTNGAMNLYADTPYRRKLEADLKKMEAEAAVRDWEIAKFYAKRGENKAAAFYSECIAKDYPDSPQATQARELLAKLGPENAADILAPAPRPKATSVAKAEPGPKAEPEMKTEPGESEEPGRLTLSDQDAKPISETE